MAICVGCGLDVNEDGVLIVDLASTSCLSCTDGNGLAVVTAPGGGLTCTGSGLAISGAGAVGIVADDSATIDFSGDGSSGSHLSAAVKRSTEACNGIRLDASGVFAYCPRSVVVSANVGFTGGAIPFGMTGVNNTYNLGTISGTTVTNNTDRALSGFWGFYAYGGVITGASADFDATAFLTQSLDGGPLASTPLSNTKYYGDADKTVFELGGFASKDFDVILPGVTRTFNAQFTIFVATGTATWAVGPNFELYAHFTPTECC